MAPKNAKARKAWLAGLKDGDEVAVVNEYDDCHLVAISSRFGVFWCAGRQFSKSTGKRLKRHGHNNTPTFLMPVTEEMRRRKNVEELRERIVTACLGTGLRACTDDQILAVSAILWPEVKT